MRLLTTTLRSRRRAWATLLLAVLATVALFALLPKSEAGGSPQTGLSATAESERVKTLLADFPDADSTVGLLLFVRTDGSALTPDDLAAVGERATALADLSTLPRAVAPVPSESGKAALVTVPLSASGVEDDAAGTATELRATARDGLPGDLQALLGGPVGFQSDIAGAFAGADFRLLLVTALVVAALLIVTYRSPVLWIVPLLTVGVADGLARVVVGAFASATGLPVDASISGILSVLVFGAGTNYALLLVARYREELRLRDDRFEAMRVAVTGAAPAILASGGTVTLSLLALALAELAGNRALGIACAIGIVIAMAFAVVVLPVALVVCGRGLFWPFVPKVDRAGAPRGFWFRLGTGVSRRPAVVAIASVLGIGVLFFGLGGYSVGLSQADQLIGTPESVVAQSTLDTEFSAGSSGGTVVLAPDDSRGEVLELIENTAGVSDAREEASANGLTRIDVSLDADPLSDEAFQTVTALRSALASAPGDASLTLVGGTDATQLDYRAAAARDLNLIAPVILGIVALILALLLRSVVAPILLLLTVLATFFASLGASTWIFSGILGFDAFDTSVTLFSFLFLVALGVDYNIFLTTRAREERPLHGTRNGMVRALSSTGAVITSAGVLLAAVFAVLGVLPVVALAQIGVIVCIGVLLDTLVVRTLLVPSLVFILGERFWWPSKPVVIPAYRQDASL